MIIDGKMIAGNVLTELHVAVEQLRSNGVIPTLAVILVGDDPGSLSYIKQKHKAGERVGIRVLFEHFPDTISPDLLASAIAHFNADPTVHGLIIQRPVPSFIGETGDILMSVAPQKDVDGFLPNSQFEVPVAKAVMTLLESVHTQLSDQSLVSTEFLSWLRTQRIAVIGRGETAGKPIASLLEKNNCATSIIHSHTPNPDEILKNASIIISCVGKPHTVGPSNISTGVILISVGLSRDESGKLHGDYESEEISSVASFYTPTPGGVGPVNVASLMQNVVEATSIQNT